MAGRVPVLFVCVCLCSITFIISFYSNEVFKAWTFLAILDHNHHIGREAMSTCDGHTIYDCIWRRRTKEWDVIPRKEEKTYTYIPSLVAVVFDERAASSESLRHSKATLPSSHSANIQATIATREPPSTSELVQKKHSRFTQGKDGCT